MQKPGYKSICLLGQKVENVGRNILSQEMRQTDHGQTELSNMLVKKNVLNEINKEGTFPQSFKDNRKIIRKVSQNLDNLQNLLIKLRESQLRESVATL